MIGLLEPDCGRVELFGKDLRRLKAKELRRMRRSVQLLFQNASASLKPNATVLEILAEALRIHNLAPKTEIHSAAARALASVGLPEGVLYATPWQLSGGQRQRVALARILLLQPAVMILDEPTTGLDMSVKGGILNLLLSLRREREDLTYVVISHDPYEVAVLCNRVCRLQGGRLVNGPPPDPSQPASIQLPPTITR
jgi:peptide/nickel transport system ATP-binding protein